MELSATTRYDHGLSPLPHSSDTSSSQTPSSPTLSPSPMPFTPSPDYPELVSGLSDVKNLTSSLSHTGTIADEERVLQLWDIELSRIRNLLDDMQKERDALEQRITIRIMASSSSSFRRLPTEIWGEIFRLCAGDYRLSVSYEKWNEVKAMPVVLSHVCRRWREVVVGYSALWSSVYLNLCGLERDIMPVLEYYLQRSGERGVDVYVVNTRMCAVQAGPSGHDRKMARLLETIIEHLPKFRRFSVQGGRQLRSMFEKARPEMRLPLLEAVHLDVELDVSQSPDWLWKSIQQAPKLRDVFIGPYTFLSPTNLSDLLAQSRIRVLDVGDTSALHRRGLDILQLLPTIPHLEELRVDGHLDVEEPFFPIVECPRLRKLMLLRGGNPQPFLDSMWLPILESLEISGSKRRVMSAPESLLGSLEKYSTTLKSFSFDFKVTPRVGPKIVERLLRALPGLEQFSSRIRGGGEECIVGLLSAMEKDNTLFSRLPESISLEASDAVLDFSHAFRIVSLLETLTDANSLLYVREMALLFGAAGWLLSGQDHVDVVSNLSGRLQNLTSHNGPKTALFLSSWGHRTILMGSDTFHE